MKSILISHSNDEPDLTITMELYRYLSDHKIDCWVDALMQAGGWRGQIGKVMLETPIVIFVASRNSITSDEVMKEVVYYHKGKKEGKIVIPFVIDKENYLHPENAADDAIYDFVYEFGANSLQAVFMENYASHEEAFERLIRLLPESVSRLENNPADFEYSEGDKILTCYHGSDDCVAVPPYVREIAREAFLNNESIRKVIVPPSVEKIGMRAFCGCTNLAEATGMEGLKEIEATVFDETPIAPCAQNGYFYAGIAFGGEEKERRLAFPEGTRIIANEALRYCGAEQIDFPQSLKSIGAVAFSDSIFIKELRIPASVERIGKNAFRGCRRLESVVFDGELPQGAEDGFENLQKLLNGEKK